jgi:hypothetical protein
MRDGKHHTNYPDFAVTLMTGQTILIEIKARILMPLTINRRRISVLRSLCRQHGWGMLVTDGTRTLLGVQRHHADGCSSDLISDHNGFCQRRRIRRTPRPQPCFVGPHDRLPTIIASRTGLSRVATTAVNDLPRLSRYGGTGVTLSPIAQCMQNGQHLRTSDCQPIFLTGAPPITIWGFRQQSRIDQPTQPSRQNIVSNAEVVAELVEPRHSGGCVAQDQQGPSVPEHFGSPCDRARPMGLLCPRRLSHLLACILKV